MKWATCHGLFLIRTRFHMSDLILLRFRIFPVTNGKEECQITLQKTVFIYVFKSSQTNKFDFHCHSKSSFRTSQSWYPVMRSLLNVILTTMPCLIKSKKANVAPPLYVYRRSYPKRCSSMNGRRRKSKNQLHIKIPRNSKRDGLPENNCSPKVTLIFSFLLNPESNRPPESSGPLEIYAKVFSCWTKIGSLT